MIYQVNPSTLPAVFHIARAGDTIQWAPGDYHYRLVITRSINTEMIPGSIGKANFIADGATELVQDQPNPVVMGSPTQGGSGAILVASPAAGPKLMNVRISGVAVSGGRRENSYTGADGNQYSYSWGCGGVHLYAVERVHIENCQLTNNENGIFGKSYGEVERDLADIAVRGNAIAGNGIANGQDGPTHHNTYIEGFRTIYEFNTYGDCLWGSASLADRSADPIIRFNVSKCGAGDNFTLVEPDDGQPTLTMDPNYGRVRCYGNVLVMTGGQDINRAVNFGTEGDGTLPQKQLWFYRNTVLNNPDPNGRSYTFVDVDKFSAGTDVQFFNNLFAAVCTDPSQFSGDYWLITQAGSATVGKNLAPTWFNLRADPNVVLTDLGQMLFVDDPLMVDWLNGDYRLRAGSPAIGSAMVLTDPNILPVDHAYGILPDGTLGWVQIDPSHPGNLGACTAQ